jgi:2-dehydropantoate 2-reductase
LRHDPQAYASQAERAKELYVEREQIRRSEPMTTRSTPTIAVVGPGAIGTTIAAALHEVGRTPLLCGRTPRAGLELRIGERQVIVPGLVRTEPSAAIVPVDLVFLAVKSTQIEAAAPWMSALCRDETIVCVLQNGVEQEAMVRPYVSKGSVMPAVVWIPAEAQPDGSVRLRGSARLTLPDSEHGRQVHDALADTFCAVELADDFRSVVWRKLMQNALAGLMALTGRRSGMFRRDDLAELSRRYLWECLAVARADGAVLDDGVPDQILERFQSNPSDMGTSVLADREAGRQLEWVTRNSIIARLGAVHGVPTPVSDVVVPLLAATSDGPG